MPRIKITDFIGPSNTLRSVNADDDKTINWMEEPTAPGPSAKNPAWLTTTPGLHPWIVFGSTPIRALFEQDGRAFVVAGSTYYEVFSDATYVSRGSVTADVFQASICSNGSAGNQNLVVSGGKGYIHNLTTNAFAEIADADFPDNVAQAEFMDGYFIVFVADTRRFFISALEDGTSWDALDFGERSDASDNIQSMKRVGRLIFFLGTKTSEPWYDSGDPLFPFAPVQSSFIDRGSAARFAATRVNDTLVWLGRDENGIAQVWSLEGLRAVPLSTPAVSRDIEAAFGEAPEAIQRSVLFSYQQDDHVFAVLQYHQVQSRPTPVYDFLTGHWHDRGRYIPGTGLFIANSVQTHMYAFGKHLVGDARSGAVYHMSTSFYNEELVG